MSQYLVMHCLVGRYFYSWFTEAAGLVECSVALHYLLDHGTVSMSRRSFKPIEQSTFILFRTYLWVALLNESFEKMKKPKMNASVT